jgi:hypothetical protein
LRKGDAPRTNSASGAPVRVQIMSSRALSVGSAGASRGASLGIDGERRDDRPEERDNKVHKMHLNKEVQARIEKLNSMWSKDSFPEPAPKKARLIDVLPKPAEAAKSGVMPLAQLPESGGRPVVEEEADPGTPGQSHEEQHDMHSGYDCWSNSKGDELVDPDTQLSRRELEQGLVRIFIKELRGAVAVAAAVGQHEPLLMSQPRLDTPEGTPRQKGSFSKPLMPEPAPEPSAGAEVRRSPEPEMADLLVSQGWEWRQGAAPADEPAKAGHA